MTTAKMTLVAVLTLLATQARADDSPRPEQFQESDPQPSNAPFDEFQSKPRHVNFRIDPIAPLQIDLFFRQWGATVDFALFRSITLGPSIRGGPSFKNGDSYAFVHKLGVTGGYYLNGNNLTDSFVVWPSWYFWSFPSSGAASGDQVLGEMACREVSLLAGFQWFYQTGWNLNLAGGLKYRYYVQNVTIINSHGAVIPSDLSTGVSFSLELTIGLAK